MKHGGGFGPLNRCGNFAGDMMANTVEAGPVARILAPRFRGADPPWRVTGGLRFARRSGYYLATLLVAQKWGLPSVMR